MKGPFAAFIAGLIFAAGLGVSGMTKATKVIGFLDVLGPWDPSLAFVMVGAIGVHAVFLRWVRKRGRPLFASAFDDPTATRVDLRLVGGAAIFGVGWGLSGFCPGPAIVSLASRSVPTLAFFFAMATGLALTKLFASRGE